MVGSLDFAVTTATSESLRISARPSVDPGAVEQAVTAREIALAAKSSDRVLFIETILGM